MTTAAADWGRWILGSIRQFAEWTTDRLGLTRAQAGLPDTMLDMAVGSCGALLVLLIQARPVKE